MEKQILINASCQAFSVNELVPEKKAVARLKTLMNNFNWSRSRPGMKEDKLSVRTTVVNPEFRFR